MLNRRPTKLKAPAVCAATILLCINRFLASCLIAFLTIISAVADEDAQISAEELNPAEQWVVAKVNAGEAADLTRKFPEEKDRRLRADFLKELLTGRRPDAQPQRNGVRIVGATIDEQIEISNEQVPWDISLERCKFKRPATFDHTSFSWNISFDCSAFGDRADFNNVKVTNNASFRYATFARHVNFSSADIGNSFNASWATFQNEVAIFNSMKVRGDTFFNDTEFDGPVYFSYASIANNFNANEAKFENKNRAVFSGIKIGGNAIFRRAKFEGPVDFSYASIADNFNANDAKFKNEKAGAVFSGMKVGGEANFCCAEFLGPVNFNYADVARLSLSSPSLTVPEQFHMQGMSYKYIRVVQRDRCPPGSLSPLLLYSLNPKASAVSPRLYLPNFRLQPPCLLPHPMYAAAAAPVVGDVGGQSVPTLLSRFTPDLGRREIQSRLYPVFVQTGFDASSQPEPESESRGALLQLAKQSAYSADVYGRLEEFFSRQADRADADEAFMAGKRREREEYFRSGQWGNWLRSWMLCLLVGYGRRPWQVGIPCIVLVALGCVLFSPNKMEPRNPAEAPRVYSRFWYSLGLFLPFVDLQADKVWKPKTDQTFLRNYMRVHMLLGWILIPIVLAAITGLLK